jgi:HSP20 family protein
MLLNYEPFHPAEASRLLGRFTAPGSATGRTAMPMDVHRLDDHVVVAFDLPGVDPDAIDVTVEGNALTVRAERTSRAGDDVTWIVAERPRGAFQRRLMLGRDLDPDRLTAAYHDGVLTLSVPVSERARPRRIAVGEGAASDDRQITEAPAL